MSGVAEGSFAFRLDGRGGGSELAPEEARAAKSPEGLVWLHVGWEDEEARAWLAGPDGIDEVAREALLAEEPRPRGAVHGDALLVVLRGVNLNPGADVEDMVSVRAWMEPGRIITAWRRPVMALREVERAVRVGQGPRDRGEFLVMLLDGLSDRIGDAIAELEDRVDDLEDAFLDPDRDVPHAEIANLRRKAIAFRRHLAPQRDAVVHLQSSRVTWLDERDRVLLRELADRTTRYLEDLDAARERASIAHEQVTNQIAERTNRAMYMLTIVAAVFLPLGLLTGLLGINVGGIPGSKEPTAFLVVCGLLVLIAAAEIWFFKVRRWF